MRRKNFWKDKIRLQNIPILMSMNLTLKKFLIILKKIN